MGHSGPKIHTMSRMSRMSRDMRDMQLSHVTHVTHVTWVTLVKLLVHKSHVTHVTGISCWNFRTKIQKKHVTGTRNTRMSHLSLLCPIMSLIWKCYLNDKEHFHFHGGLCKISIEIECLVNVS